MSQYVAIRGVPQNVYKIPLKDIPEEGLVGIEPVSLIDRIIMGPSQFPFEIAEIFFEKLRNIGAKDPGSLVQISGIPLRV